MHVVQLAGAGAMPGKIFVNYRRDDDPNGAARIREGLAAKFGKAAVFMDVDNLLAGQRFDEELAKALSQCDVLIAVIGPRWMDLLRARAESGERDYVREEIAEALRRKVIVIPVRVGREGQMPALPRPADLPEDIRDLVLYQKHDVAYERFGRDMAELIEAIQTVRRTRQPELASRFGAKAPAAAAVVAVMAVGGAIAWYVLNPGSSLTTADPLPAKVAPPSSVADRAKAVADAAQAEVERRAPAAAAAWEQVKTSSEVAALDAFVARFGDTTYGELAKSRLANLRQEQARVAAAAEAKRRADEAEQQRVAALQKQEDDRRRAEAAAAEAKRKAHEEARGRDPVAALAPGSGRSARDCPVCPEMVVVPAGRFTMGSPANELERYADETQVAVTIARAFAVGRFAVTFAEWDACVADGGCGGYKPDDEKWGRGNRPVINVNWNDAKAYVAWLSKKTGKSYRLLSEAEREYVARAGTTTPFWWGGTITPRQANYDGNFQYAGGGAKGEYRRRTVPVDSFEANPWGLHQVHGNVWEWTEDCWNGSNAGNPGDGSARTSGACSQRVVRGGSWYYGPRGLRSALRIWFTTVDRDYDRGFRVGRSVVP